MSFFRRRHNRNRDDGSLDALEAHAFVSHADDHAGTYIGSRRADPKGLRNGFAYPPQQAFGPDDFHGGRVSGDLSDYEPRSWLALDRSDDRHDTDGRGLETNRDR